MCFIRRALSVVLAVAAGASVAAAQLPMESMPPPGPPPLTAPARGGGQALPPPADLQRLAQTERPGDDGFEPISELPPDERLPAAPMLVAAYVFVILALFLYLFSLSRRLAAVKQEIARLETDVKRSGRA